MKKIFSLESNFSVGKATIIIGVLSLLSRLIGLYRDRLFASHFGAGDTLDVYYTAFRIPDFIFNLLILGTLSAAFVPIFSKYLVKDRQQASQIASTIFNTAFLGMGLISIILFIFCEPLTKILVPGFSGEKLDTTVHLTRLLLLSPIIFTVSNVLSSILITLKQFLIVNTAPLLYNLGIIFGIIWLYPRYGLMGLGYGVLIGAVLHLLIQIPAVLRQGFSWKPIANLNHPAVKQIGHLFLPRIFGLDASYISLIIASVIGSVIGSGAIAVFNLANNLQAVPLGIFALSTAVAVFPALSEAFAKDDEKNYSDLLDKAIIQILFFIIPISILMLVFRAYIVRIILGTGAFDWRDTILTFETLGVFTFSLIAQSLLPLFSRAFFARHNTIIPTVSGLITMAINAGLSYLLAKPFGIVGVAAGFAIATSLNCLALFILLRRHLYKANAKIVPESDHILLTNIGKIITASIVLGAVAYGAIYAIAPLVDTHTVLGIIIQAGVAGLFAVSSFMITSYWLGLDQARHIASYLKKFMFWQLFTAPAEQNE